MPDTHVVANQVRPFAGHNTADSPVLMEALHREGAGWAEPQVTALGALSGSQEMAQCAIRAERDAPILRTHDRFGHRIDEVEYGPDYHRLMTVAVEHGLAGGAWTESRPGAHVARAAKMSVWQVDAGHSCPISMTYAVVPALRAAPELAAIYEPLLTTRTYDPSVAPPLTKRALTAGMSMTEKQGGSDVRSGTTDARPQPDGTYRLTGHKWFCSAPMSDAFLVLAQTDAGLSCFLMPRVLPDGSRNAFRLQRLKDKLGNRSNASGEVEFDDAFAYPVGEPGRGVPTIAEMINCTRLDCIVGSAATMRAALAQAVHHARHRATFGRLLVDHPAMRNVLADLALESEAATALFARIARAVDEDDARLRRIGTAIGKYWVCKRAAAFVGEALEVLGGNGYVEESALPRLYREAPLNSIWEGSGNINALDVLRVITKEPHALEALLAEIGPAPELGPLVRDADESSARFVVERLALHWQAAILRRSAPYYVSDAFDASRIRGKGGRAFGTLPKKTEFEAILARI